MYEFGYYGYDMAELILDFRNLKTFGPIWRELHLEQSYDESYLEQIKNDTENIYQNIPENLHHDLRLAIIKDYQLMASYLVSGEENDKIAFMFLCYANGEVPILLFDSKYNLEYAFIKLKVAARIAKLRNRANYKSKLIKRIKGLNF